MLKFKHYLIIIVRSKGTAGIRGTRILNNGRYYWELKVSQRVFGTRYVV